MPEPNRPPWRIAQTLSGFAIGDMIDAGVTVVVECESCRHRAMWSADDLALRFGTARRTMFERIGPRLRCGTCRSEWVRVFRE